MLLTCPWSEQPPTEAPEIEDDEEVVRLEFVDGEVKGFYDKQEVTKLEQDGEEVVVEAAEYEIVKEEEEEDLWTKSMDEWAERQRSSGQKIDPYFQLHRVFIMFAFFCLLK